MLVKQFQTLAWKQRANLRTDWTSVLVVACIPSLLLYLSSTSGSITSNTTDLVPCVVDNFLYCNAPMQYEIDEGFRELFVNETQTSFLTAATNVANEYGLDTVSDMFVPASDAAVQFPSKVGGQIQLENETRATVTWYTGENNAFATNFVTLFNENLKNVNSTIQFEQIDNPYEYDGSNNAFDLRAASFLLLIQNAALSIGTEKQSHMYYYLTRAGLLPFCYWAFQYIYWMTIGSIAVLFAYIMSIITNKEISVPLCFVAVWFHLSLGVLVGTILTQKRYINFTALGFLIVSFAVPLIFQLALPDAVTTYKYIRTIPLFYFVGKIDDEAFAIQWGSIITMGIMLLSSYLRPLITVSDGMYTGSKRNYAYFLSMKFWKEGIVATPSYVNNNNAIDAEGFYNDTAAPAPPSSSSSDAVGRPILEFKDCVKDFGNDKIIGPMNLSLSAGSITTLLGPNGVGKTTFLRVASGYYIPSQGEIILDQSNLFRESTFSSLQNISFCPQDNYLYEYMTVREHLELIATFRDMSRIHTSIDAHLEWILVTLDIANKSTTLAKNLSGGMKRRLCLAMSAVGFPKVMLCDEPSSGVDIMNQRGIWKLLETAAKKYQSSILLTTHSSLEAVILSDSVVTMTTSVDIAQTCGTEGITFVIKDEVDKVTKEYEVTDASLNDIPNIISSIPNDGSEWRIVSKRLASGVLPPLSMVLHKDEDENVSDNERDPNNVDEDDENESLNVMPLTLDWEQPTFLRQIRILLSVVALHPERTGFTVLFGLPLNAALVFIASQYKDWNDTTILILTPMIPIIFILANGIILCNAIGIIANERDLGVSKLLFGQGISRLAYVSSYFIWYFTVTYPIAIATLIVIGSVHGTSSGVFALLVLFTSFWVFCIGICLMLSSILDPGTAFVFVMIFPSILTLYSMGSLNQTFSNSYPGAVGQVMAGLLVDNVNSKEWTLFGISITVNFVLGALGLYIFLANLGNYNPLRWWWNNRKSSTVDGTGSIVHPNDIETNHDTSIFLEGRNIVKTYGIGANDTASFRALDDVTFGVKNGSLLGLVGKSGAGKSTLMDVLSGQLSVTSGSVHVEGNKVKPNEISTVVSMCGQLDTIWPDMPVHNAIVIFMLCRGYKGGNVFCSKKIADPYISYLIEKLGMKEMLKKPVKKLSGGQKRRLAFLVALMGKTKVVLVDEAMTGVDIMTRQIMWQILQDEVRLHDRSVVVTSHDISEVEQYCNTVGILHDGKLVEMGLLSDIKKKFGDSVKLICLFNSNTGAAAALQNTLVLKHPEIKVESPDIDYLDESEKARIIATYAIDLVTLENITGFISTMNDEYLRKDILVYWSIEPQSLDDFVRASSVEEPFM